MPDSPHTADIFGEMVKGELARALDNYEHDPDDNGALNRLTNNCVSIGYEFALRTPDPEAAEEIKALREALEKIVVGSKLGTELFEQRIRERKDRLAWYAVSVLQDNLAACEGTASAALKDHRKVRT